MLTNLLYLIILILGFPTGIFLAKLCKEELKSWKRRLFIINIIAFIYIGGMFFTNFLYKIPIILSLFFIIIVCLTIIWKSV